jgi:transcription termination factor NusB
MDKYLEALLEIGIYNASLSIVELLQELDDKETKKTTPVHELINECIELLKISGDNTKSKVLNKLLDFKHRYLDE